MLPQSGQKMEAGVAHISVVYVVCGFFFILILMIIISVIIIINTLDCKPVNATFLLSVYRMVLQFQPAIHQVTLSLCQLLTEAVFPPVPTL